MTATIDTLLSQARLAHQRAQAIHDLTAFRDPTSQMPSLAAECRCGCGRRPDDPTVKATGQLAAEIAELVRAIGAHRDAAEVPEREDAPTALQPVRVTDHNGHPVGPDNGLVICSECSGTFPNECPDLCGTLSGTIPSGPPPVRRRPFRIGLGGRVAQ